MDSEKCDNNSSCPTCNQVGTCSEEEKEAHDLTRRDATMSLVKYKILD